MENSRSTQSDDCPVLQVITGQDGADRRRVAPASVLIEATDDGDAVDEREHSAILAPCDIDPRDAVARRQGQPNIKGPHRKLARTDMTIVSGTRTDKDRTLDPVDPVTVRIA
jgi:hypothetical protein